MGALVKTKAELAAENRALKKSLRDMKNSLDSLLSSVHNKDVNTLTEWQRRGGQATARTRTPEQRSAAARKAALARWGRRTVTVDGKIGGKPNGKR